jgi:hypothetical protein
MASGSRRSRDTGTLIDLTRAERVVQPPTDVNLDTRDVALINFLCALSTPWPAHFVNG